jgi:bifunctional DNase/RNase
MDESLSADAANDVVFRVVQVDQVTYDFSGASAAIVLREAEGARRLLSLPVALNDATAIHHAWQHVAGRRPATNELVVSILQELHVDVIAARILRVDVGVYYGELDLMTKEGRRVFDCRPSDAIVLALRQVVPAPLLVAQGLLTPV